MMAKTLNRQLSSLTWKQTVLYGIFAIIFTALSLTGCDNGNGPGGDPPLSGSITISPTGPVPVGTPLVANYTGTGIVNYQWKRGSTNVGSNSRYYTPDQAGSYTVTVSASGYQSKTSAAVTVSVVVSSDINLFASLWEGADGSGESMNTGNQIKLSDFTAVKPAQTGDVFKFKISGNASVQLKNCEITIMQMQGDNWDTYKWLGSSEIAELPNPFVDCIFETTIWVAPAPNLDFYVTVANTLWRKDPSGNYTYNSGYTLTPGTQNGDVVGTISNFSISLVVESGGENGGGNGPGTGPGGSNNGGGKFVAAGMNNEYKFIMAHSTDGGTWTAVTDSALSSATIYGIAYGNDRFIAVGKNANGAAVYVSY